jgi:hypothetical protein
VFIKVLNARAFLHNQMNQNIWKMDALHFMLKVTSVVIKLVTSKFFKNLNRSNLYLANFFKKIIYHD